MKYITLMLLCFTAVVFAQESPSTICIDVFLRMQNPYGNFPFRAQSISVFRWDENYFLTQDSISDIIIVSDGGDDECNGWDLNGDCSSYPKLGHNIYSIMPSFSEKTARVYINAYGYERVGGDIHLVYDYSLDKFLLSTSDCGDYSGTQLSNDTVLTYYAPGYTKYQPTSPTNLSIVNYINHPKLTWRLSEPATAAKYRIYRNNSLIDSTNSGDTTYIDNNVRINGGTNEPFTYKVRAVSGDWSKLSPDYSNQETVYGIEQLEKQGVEMPSSSVKEEKSKILGIYPNPFNPVTRIRYSVAEQSAVKISVSDIVGRVVETLLDEEKPKGDYEIAFNGSALSSGTYFCTLRVGALTDIQKLIIQK